jgi:prepilin-type processing-associated H-X9-DG protein
VDGAISEGVKPIEVYICPVDTDISASQDNAGVSYSVDGGAWDRNASGVYLSGSNIGDTVHNGLFHNLTDGTTKSKLDVNDGASTTIMMSENSTKDPSYSWLGVPANGYGEAQLAILWVVNATPSIGNTIYDQERISQGTGTFTPSLPLYARPASNHPSGSVNVVFVDGHTMSLQPTINYVVYQQLMTPYGKKCDDPASPRGTDTATLPVNDPIRVFRTAPPLSEKDFAE